MKEALIVGLDGVMKDVTLVDDKSTGVTLINESDYIVSVPRPEGLFAYKWDFELEQWVEGLTAEEITARKQPVTPVITLEERIRALEDIQLEQMLGGL